jgi:hypothetical protein
MQIQSAFIRLQRGCLEVTTKTIQISFNMDDPYQKKLYDYAKQQARNMSLWGRSLIQRDMNKSWEKEIADDEIQMESIDLNENIFKGFI